MRYRELLLEYNRDLTAKQFGEKLLNKFIRDLTLILPVEISRQLGSVVGADDPDFFNKLSNEQIMLLINGILSAIENKDPTPNKAYTPWLARMYSNGDIKYEDLNRGNLIGIYDLGKKRRMIRPEHNDINSFKTYKQFEDTMLAKYDLDAIEASTKEQDQGKATKVYEDSQVSVIVPLDEAAACRYGRGTRWCTAATRGENYFNHYNRQGKLYILIPKKPEHEGEKYQLHFATNQFMNEDDDPVMLSDILLNRFKDEKLVEYFKSVEPDIKRLVEFADNDKLDKSIHSLGDLVMERVYEVVNNWEMEDDYYHRYLRDEGYVDEEGDIDWDKVEQDGKTYLEYNYEANEFLEKMQETVYIPAQKLKDEVKDLYQEGIIDTSPEMPDLENVIVELIRRRFSGRRGYTEDGGIIDFINKQVMMVRDGGDYKAELAKRRYQR